MISKAKITTSYSTAPFLFTIAQTEMRNAARRLAYRTFRIEHHLPAANHRLAAANHRLAAANHRLVRTNHRLAAANDKTPKCGLLQAYNYYRLSNIMSSPTRLTYAYSGAKTRRGGTNCHPAFILKTIKHYSPACALAFLIISLLGIT